MLYSYVHPEDRERVRRAFERALREGEDYDIEHRAVSPIYRRVRWVRAMGRCSRNRDGKPYHFDGIICDVTRKKEEQERLRHTEERLRQTMEKELAEATLLRERLLGVVSHDLKNPLATISMAASLLGEQPLDEAGRKHLERVRRCAERMKRLIDQLLDFARLRACGELPIEPRPVDLHLVCCHVVDELSVAFPKITISLETSGDGQGVWDGVRIAEVLSNLLGNAIQHGRDGPVSLRVAGDGDGVVIVVHNQGPSIPPDILPFIFDPYQQGEQRGRAQSQSLGLGLYIVKQIVLAHGGQIDVKSRDDEGTTFSIRLPRHRQLDGTGARHQTLDELPKNMH